MSKKILIDLVKLRDLEERKAEALFKEGAYRHSFKTIRELATFMFTCRKCENAPCINVCPADALEKNPAGIVQRSVNLCVRCKSCISVCPFGTLMDDLFQGKTSGYDYFDLDDEDEFNRFAASFPEEVARITEEEENSEEQIFKLNEKVLVSDKIWQ